MDGQSSNASEQHIGAVSETPGTVEPKPMSSDIKAPQVLAALIAEATTARDRILELASSAETASKRCTSSENNAVNKQKLVSRAEGEARRAADEVLRLKEELAVAIAAAQAARDASAAAAGESKGTLEVIKGVHDTARESALAISTLRAQVDEHAAASAERSRHIEDGKKHADETKAQLESTLKEVEGARAAVASSASAAQKSASQVKAHEDAARESREITETVEEEIDAAKKLAVENMEVTRALAEKAAGIETELKGYEKDLAGVESEFRVLKAQIEGLLPGATSAGLASSFEQRAAQFKIPERRWQWVFLASVVALLGIAVLDLYILGSEAATPNYEEMLRVLIHRLPIAVPLIWLAIYASRQSALAKRLEEEYGFKAAIAKSFEGFRNQMAEVDTEVKEGSPVLKLCNDMLQTIGSPPGRIYEVSRPDVSPVTAAAESAGPLADATVRAVRPN